MQPSSRKASSCARAAGAANTATCGCRIEPLPRGTGYEFVNGIVGGVVPREYIPAVDKGVREQMANGVIAGYPVVDVRVTIFDGSYHDVDSSEIAFKIAGSMAFKEGAKKAEPVLLEPIMNVEVVTPADYMGDVNGDLSRRRGVLQGSKTGRPARSCARKCRCPRCSVTRRRCAR